MTSASPMGVSRCLACAQALRARLCAVVIGVILGLAPVALAAQPSQGTDLTDLGLEELLDLKVYAASKKLQDAAQAPASVSIIDADEIRRQGYRTLADVLRTVRGFFVTNDRNYNYVGVRGFQRPGDFNGRVLLLLNGHRMNDNVYEQALLGTESPIDIELIERVEVIRGPSSSLYGTSAFFAVINLITRTGTQIGGVEAIGQAGSQALGRARVSAGGRTAGGAEGLVSVTGYRTAGNDRLFFPEFDAGDGVSGIAANADRDRFSSVFASGSRGGFSVQAGIGNRRKQLPTAPYESLFNDPRADSLDRRSFAHVRYNRRLDARTTLELRGAYDQYEYQGAFPYVEGVQRDTGRGGWVTTEAAVVRQFSRHALTAGFEYRNNFRQDQTAVIDGADVLLDDRRRSDVTGLYVEDEFRIAPRLLVSAGVRWDQYYGRFGGTVNPRVAVIATPRDHAVLKLLYGRAFRAPNPFELYYGQSRLSARLRPEHIHTFETNWQQRITPRLQAIVSGFRNDADSLIVQRAGDPDTLDGLYYDNGDKVTARGLEFELQGELPGRVRTRIGQVLQRVRRDSTNRILSNAPKYLTTMVVEVPVPRIDAHVAFNGFFIGERRRVSEGMIPSSFVGNLTVSRRLLGAGLGVGLTIYNVFNATWADPGSVEHRQQMIPQDGRTAILRVSWRM